MTKKELKELNAELIGLLASMREQIDDTLEELSAIADDDDDVVLPEADGDSED